MRASNVVDQRYIGDEAMGVDQQKINGWFRGCGCERGGLSRRVGAWGWKVGQKSGFTSSSADTDEDVVYDP